MIDEAKHYSVEAADSAYILASQTETSIPPTRPLGKRILGSSCVVSLTAMSH